MENFSEQEIDQLLRDEIKRLKEAVAYIEELKDAAFFASRKLSEMHSKTQTLTRLISDFEIRYTTMKEDSENKFSSSLAIYQSNLTGEFEKLTTENKKTTDILKAEINLQKKSIKNLKFIVIICFVVAIIFILIAIMR